MFIDIKEIGLICFLILYFGIVIGMVAGPYINQFSMDPARRKLEEIQAKLSVPQRPGKIHVFKEADSAAIWFVVAENESLARKEAEQAGILVGDLVDQFDAEPGMVWSASKPSSFEGNPLS